MAWKLPQTIDELDRLIDDAIDIGDRSITIRPNALESTPASGPWAGKD